MKYKLLAIDIDDTILPRNGVISERDKLAVKKAAESGIYVTLATGRGFHGSSRIISELGVKGLVINYGGAMINDASTGKPFFVTELAPSTVNLILDIAENMGLHVHLYQGDTIVYEHDHYYGKAYSEHLDLPAVIDPDIRKKVWTNVPKVLVITEPEKVDELLPIFSERLKGLAAVSASSPGFIEFNKIGANKGTALAMLADHIGVKREETAAIGDNTLDREMIEWAGLGACVMDGNAVCKAAADVVLPSCREDAVACFIENYLFKDSDESISLGFDIGGTTIKGGAVNKELDIVCKLVKPTPKGDPDALCELIKQMADELSCGRKIIDLGITIPGSVDKDGSIIDAWNLGIRQTPIKQMISRLIKAENVTVRNDADAAAVAELHKGALKGVKTGLLLTLGTGVGGALIIGGELFHGGLDRGTELGHAVLSRGGKKCACGHLGCIETLCSATALKRKAQEAVDHKKGLIYAKASEGAEVDAKLLIDCAKEGDKIALELFDDYVDALADAIASFVNVFDPEVIAIGGGVSLAGDMLFDRLRRLIPEKCFFGSCGMIVPAECGNDAGMIGSVI